MPEDIGLTPDILLPAPLRTHAIVAHYRQLQGRCQEILEETFRLPDNVDAQAKSQLLLNDLRAWAGVIRTRPEAQVLAAVSRELEYALLAVAQGQYREAFRGLRLVVELTLQVVNLSTNRLELEEWLEKRRDTIWSQLICSENGVLSVRYTRAFFPDLEDHVSLNRSLAERLYRECSECVHGNVPRQITLPDNLEFKQETFSLWHRKTDTATLVLNFALAVRYCRELGRGSLATLEVALLDRLGHIPAIRQFFGNLGGE